MSQADNTIYNDSANSIPSEIPFAYKEWGYVTDSNNLSYANGSVIISTENISNNGNYLSMKEAEIRVPLILTLSGKNGLADTAPAIDWTAVKGEYIAALKSGYWNLMSQMIVECNNGSLIQNVEFSNVYTSYKVNTSFSSDQLATLGPSIGYYPDSCDSWAFRNDQPTSFGVGSCNNNNVGSVFNGSSGSFQNQGINGNEGLIARQLSDNIGTVGETTESFKGGVDANSLASDLRWGLDKMTDRNRMVLVGSNRVESTDKYCAIYITATIRLRDIHDFFDKFPLTRGTRFRFNITFNLPSFKVRKLPGTSTWTPAGGAATANRANRRLLAGDSTVAGVTNVPAAPVLDFDFSQFSMSGGGATNPVILTFLNFQCLGVVQQIQL